jgi:hypothetical protein
VISLMPLNDFDFFVLDPNTSGTADITITSTAEVEIASVRVNTAGSTNVFLDSIVGFHTAGAGPAGVILRIRRDGFSGPLVARGRDKSTFSGADEFDLTSLEHVDTATGQRERYVLTVALDPDTDTAGNRVKVIGPITFKAEAVS